MACCLCRLCKAKQTEFFLEVLPDIVRYVNYWRHKWVVWSVFGAVEAFFDAHGVVMDE